MTGEHDATERRLRLALNEIASQVQPSADAWQAFAARPRRHPPRGRVVVPAIAAAAALAVAATLTVGVVLLRGEGGSGVRTPATEPKETSTERLLPLEADAAVFMRSAAPESQSDAVRGYLLRSPDVRNFAFVDKATAYEDFKRTFRDRPDLVGSVDPSALPASFRIRLEDCASRSGVLEQLQALPGVDEAISQLGLSHADAELFRYRQGFPPSDTRGRCGDRPPTVSTPGP